MKNLTSKNQIFKFSLILISALFLSSAEIQQSHAGLFGPSADTKKNVSILKKLSTTETSLLGRYNAVTGKNYKDDYTTGMALVALVPDVSAYIGKLNALNAKDSKFQAAIDLYIQAWDKYLEGMTIFIDAIDNQDYSKAAQANSALASANSYMKKASRGLAPFLK